MIVAMKKVLLLCTAESRHDTVDALGRLGVVHIGEVIPREHEEVTRARNERERAQRAHRALAAVELTQAECEAAQVAARDSSLTGEQIIERVLQLEDKRLDVLERLEGLEAEIERIAPFGDFEPAQIQALGHAGIRVVLLRGPMRGTAPQAPRGALLQRLHADESMAYYVLVTPENADLAEADLGDSEEVSPADSSAQRLHERIEAAREEMAEIHADLAQWCGLCDRIEDVAARIHDHVRVLEVREAMPCEGPVAYIEGYAPAPRIDTLRQAAERQGWGLVVRDPEPHEEAPTLVRYPGWVRPIKAVFQLLEITPGYREADISIAFLLFFSLFFGMLVGDAGYGLLFLGMTWFARRKMPKAPAYPFALMYVLSAATIAWGALTGNFFGLTSWPSALQTVQVQWLREQKNIMGLCFFIGAVHLSLAHVWNAIARWPSLQALAQIGWVCTTWTMFYIAQAMVLGGAVPPWVYYLFALGILLIVLFMTPARRMKTDWINHAILPLDIVGNFVDVVSYIRLFAVGMATLSVAESFNSMAAGVGFHSVFAGLGAALILLAGHTLNILLCGLGILVHGVRLNTLEFSKHKEMQWSGFPYRPFARRGVETPDRDEAPAA